MKESSAIRSVLGLVLLALLTVLFSSVGTIALGDDKELSGDVTLEDVSTSQKNPYQAGQEAAIQYFREFNTLTTQIAQGSSNHAQAIPENTMIHISNAYLYCAVKFGTCPMVLDAILETDIINSKLDKSVRCPNMERFWKTWVKSDNEKRHKYLVRTATLNETNNFNAKVRPLYIKCREMVQNELTGAPGDAVFFRERYDPSSPKKEAIVKALKLLEELKLKVPNILTALESVK